ncbi:LOW QUALITY PROTEIN: hypothetical protein TorRG33x02_107450 [Trema orientale]|uniref:Uncharacterized protein n=1 Tax=Trema orientale TaxID=63057 RepID=A0A2P5F6Q5_TREOI|nr:LOW QUALITY PROTEIN: hypothetical protein TorRG33x02_107450 [Trema orientale]
MFTSGTPLGQVTSLPSFGHIPLSYHEKIYSCLHSSTFLEHNIGIAFVAYSFVSLMNSWDDGCPHSYVCMMDSWDDSCRHSFVFLMDSWDDSCPHSFVSLMESWEDSCSYRFVSLMDSWEDGCSCLLMAVYE